MATDVAVSITQQPWLVTSNSTAVGNRGCQMWHSNNLQQHLAGGTSKRWHNLMGGTKTVITNNPVVCHKFYRHVSAQEINSGEVDRVLRLYEKANDVSRIICRLWRPSGIQTKAHSDEAAAKRSCTERSQTPLLLFWAQNLRTYQIQPGLTWTGLSGLTWIWYALQNQRNKACGLTKRNQQHSNKWWRRWPDIYITYKATWLQCHSCNTNLHAEYFWQKECVLHNIEP